MDTTLMSPDRVSQGEEQDHDKTTFDLVVIGGGITGACLAYDAATRGMSVALLEKGDFGAATSSASSKLLHGGIRYLQQGRLDKVRESALERVFFQNLAPHLCHIVPFVIPSFRDLRKGRLALAAALLLYGAASAGQNRYARLQDSKIPGARLLRMRDLRSMAPLLAHVENINGGISLPECHMVNSERMTLALVNGAKSYGATVRNYAEVTELLRHGHTVTGVLVRDVETDSSMKIRAKIVANCAGPWIRELDDRTLGNKSNTITGFSRGTHAVVRDLDLPCALALPTKQKIQGIADRGGRHMFLIPWRGHALVGTSYAAYRGQLNDVAPTRADITQLTEGINGALGKDLISEDNIVHAFAGIYPLTESKIDSNVYQGTGEYEIVDHYRVSGIAGYLSVFGAKFTTARILAEKACNRIVAALGGGFDACVTRYGATPSGAFSSFAELRRHCREVAGTAVTDSTLDHLITHYGAHAIGVLDMVTENPDLLRPLGDNQDTVEAEAAYCARFEQVKYLEDFVFRRTGLGTLGNPGRSVLERAANLLAGELGWSQSRTTLEVEQTLAKFTVSPPPASAASN